MDLLSSNIKLIIDRIVICINYQVNWAFVFIILEVIENIDPEKIPTMLQPVIANAMQVKQMVGIIYIR